MKSKRVGLVVVVVVLLGALLVGACAAPTPKEKPITPEIVKPEGVWIAFNSAVSGPYAAVCAPLYPAYVAVTEYINVELGGLYGVPWRFVFMDTGYSVEKAIANLMVIKDMKPKPIGMGSTVSTETEALNPLTAEAEIPVIGSGSYPSVYPALYQFAYYKANPDAFGYFIDWLVRTGQGDKKVAFLTWDSTYGRSILEDTCYAYAEQKGVDIVATELFGMRDVDVTTQLTRIRAAGADWIFTTATSMGAYTIMKGVKETQLDVEVCGVINACVDPAVMLIDPPVFEGFWRVSGLWSADYWRDPPGIQPGIRLARDYFERQGKPETQWGTVGIYMGWIDHLIFYDAAKTVVDKYGWENLDGKHVKEVMETYTNFDPFFGTQLVSYSPTKHTMDCAMMSKVVNGRITMMEKEWGVCPDLRPAEYR